jgi:hypothetical protein
MLAKKIISAAKKNVDAAMDIIEREAPTEYLLRCNE